MRALKNLFMPHGGPNFSDCYQIVVDCGTADISLTVPRSPRFPKKPWTHPTQLDLTSPDLIPYETYRDFKDERTLHPYIDIGMGEWFYLAPRLDITTQGEPYVCATGCWRIERTKQNIQMEPGNLQRLTQYLKDDYAIFFEQEGDGDNTCGPAWRVRNQLREQFSVPGRNPEQYKAYIDGVLALDLPKLPDDYTEVTFGNTRWVRYSYVPHRGLPTAIHYSLPLDANHLLTISISLVRFLDRDEKWLAQARADFDRLVAGTQVHFRQLTEVRTPLL